MRFTALDFETANSWNGSICAVGLVVVEDGQIIERKYWLVRPHVRYDYFDNFNILIHGIKPGMVRDAVRFNTLYAEEILPRIQDTLVIAHNAAFDMSALRHILELYRIPYPTTRYLCTYKIAAKTWPHFENHKLNTVSDHLQFTFTHHNALEDALACANVLLAALREKNVTSPDELAKAIGMRIGTMCEDGYSPCSVRKGRG